MHPQIAALHDLQVQDGRLTRFERQLETIPLRMQELDTDLQRLRDMLASERKKLEETRAFQRSQEHQLSDEEDMIRQSKARLNQVKTPRELNATQRELDAARRMSAARLEEIHKLQDSVSNAEQRIATVEASLSELEQKAAQEKQRLLESRSKLEARIAKLRKNRRTLTNKIDRDTLTKYERVRKRMGGIAFVAAARERCTACKMLIPHQVYVRLVRGEEILSCEHCGRLLYWEGLFPKKEEEGPGKPGSNPKPSPAKPRPATPPRA